MAITSIGYDGSVDEQAWAKVAPIAGGRRYGVVGVNDWRVLATGTNRDVGVDPGTGYGHGVVDVSTWTPVILPTVSSGTKWFMVVARRNWGTNTTTFMYIEGGSTLAIPFRQQAPGTLDDHPIALVRVDGNGSGGSIADIVDLRVWQGDGGSYAKNTTVLGIGWTVGTEIWIGTDLWHFGINASGSAEWGVLRTSFPQRLWAGVNDQLRDWTGTLDVVGVTLPSAAPVGLYRIAARAHVGIPGTSYTQNFVVTKQILVNGAALSHLEPADLSGGISHERVQESHYYHWGASQAVFSYRIAQAATARVRFAAITAVLIGA